MAGPGSVRSVGKADVAQACCTSRLESPAGKVAALVKVLGTGITSEQSTMSRYDEVDKPSPPRFQRLRPTVFWPRTASFAIADLNAD